MRNGKYYLGRVVKGGQLNRTKLIDAIKHSVTVSAGKHSWTFTDVKHYSVGKPEEYLFGRLSKFKPRGTVTKVDRERHQQIDQVEDDLLIDSSPFVYIPEFSGIAYLHVWNEIQQETFCARFAELVVEKYQKFFVECAVEAISDLRSFSKKLTSLKSINEIHAKVNPPNPLFGRFWEELKEYLKTRNAQELKLQEYAAEGKELESDIRKIFAAIAEREDSVEAGLPKLTAKIGDQALLMAADGYGHGKVVGTDGESEIVIRTSDTIKNFLFTKTPEHQALYEQASRIFEQSRKARDMKHGNE